MTNREQETYIVKVMKQGNVDKILAFVGDTHLSQEVFEQNKQKYLNDLNWALMDMELTANISKISLIQSYLLLEDNIETLKLKILNVLGRDDLGIDDLYLFTENLTIRKISSSFVVIFVVFSCKMF